MASTSTPTSRAAPAGVMGPVPPPTTRLHGATGMPYRQHSSMVSTSMSLNTSGESEVGSNQASGRSRRASSLPARVRSSSNRYGTLSRQ